MKSLSKLIGTRGELLAEENLLGQGYRVGTFSGDCDDGDKFIMVPGKKECRVVQVKTQADTSDGHVRLFCGTYREDENKRMTKVLYSPEDVDFIAAVALDRKRVAYIPLVLALSWSPRGSLTLRLDLPRNGQKRGIHWFHEYEILERWA